MNKVMMILAALLLMAGAAHAEGKSSDCNDPTSAVESFLDCSGDFDHVTESQCLKTCNAIKRTCLEVGKESAECENALANGNQTVWKNYCDVLTDADAKSECKSEAKSYTKSWLDWISSAKSEAQGICRSWGDDCRSEIGRAHV